MREVVVVVYANRDAAPWAGVSEWLEAPPAPPFDFVMLLREGEGDKFRAIPLYSGWRLRPLRPDGTVDLSRGQQFDTWDDVVAVVNEVAAAFGLPPFPEGWRQPEAGHLVWETEAPADLPLPPPHVFEMWAETGS